jgi:hypothetical protein
MQIEMKIGFVIHRFRFLRLKAAWMVRSKCEPILKSLLAKGWM